MQGNTKVIEQLNARLADELTAINQYMVHAEMCDNWGYEHLHEEIQKRAIVEMKHAEKLITRILFLEGKPVVSVLNKINIGPDVEKMHKNDWKAEEMAVKGYNDSIRDRAWRSATTGRAKSWSRFCGKKRITSTGSKPSKARSSKWASRITSSSRPTDPGSRFVAMRLRRSVHGCSCEARIGCVRRLAAPGSRLCATQSFDETSRVTARRRPIPAGRHRFRAGLIRCSFRCAMAFLIQPTRPQP